MNPTGKNSGDRCDPAASIILKFGGVRKLARALGVDPSTLTRWQRAKNGCNGLIPARYHWTLLNLAHARSIPLTAEDIIGANGPRIHTPT